MGHNQVDGSSHVYSPPVPPRLLKLLLKPVISSVCYRPLLMRRGGGGVGSPNTFASQNARHYKGIR